MALTRGGRRITCSGKCCECKKSTSASSSPRSAGGSARWSTPRRGGIASCPSSSGPCSGSTRRAPSRSAPSRSASGSTSRRPRASSHRSPAGSSSAWPRIRSTGAASSSRRPARGPTSPGSSARSRAMCARRSSPGSARRSAPPGPPRRSAGGAPMKPAERIPTEPTRLPARPARTRRLIVAAAALVAIVIAAVAWRATRTAPAPKYETARVDRGRIVAQVTATGTLSALVTVQVGSQVSGRIQRLLVDYNSPVKKGQLIAKIDPELFEAALAQSRANHVAARGDLSRAKVQAAEPARAALQQAQVNLAYTNIGSPIDGTVISRSVDVGQTVAASLQAPTLFVIAEDLKKMQVDTSVAEADIGKLRDGMEASFSVDAFPGRKFRGAVRQIRNAPQTVQNVVTYDAVVDVANPDLDLRPGMTANVSFVFADRSDVLRVPNAGLRFRPSPELLATQKRNEPGGAPAAGGAGNGGAAAPRAGQAPGQGRRDAAGGEAGGGREPDRRTVWVLRAEQPAPVRIRTGVSDGSTTEVIEGDLRDGDAVVTDAAGPGAGAAGGSRPGGPPGRMF